VGKSQHKSAFQPSRAKTLVVLALVAAVSSVLVLAGYGWLIVAPLFLGAVSLSPVENE
jgi:hypothetical protein